MEIDRIYHGDCLELMPKHIKDKSVDMIFADLPYGTTRCKWDTPIDLKALWTQYNRVIKDNGAILLFAQSPFDKVLGASNIEMFKYEWIWEKTNATGHLNAKKMPMKAHENILVFYKKLPVYNPQKTTGHSPVNSNTKTIESQRSKVYGKGTKKIVGGGATDRYPRSVLLFPSDKQKLSLHPTQKPLSLIEYFIRTYSNPGDLILDNTAGSGTTGLAAKNTGRNFILMEKELEYFQMCQERIFNRQLLIA